MKIQNILHCFRSIRSLVWSSRLFLLGHLCVYLQHVRIPARLAAPRFSSPHPCHVEGRARPQQETPRLVERIRENRANLDSLPEQRALKQLLGRMQTSQITTKSHLLSLSGQNKGRNKARFTILSIYHFTILQRRGTFISVITSF